MEFVVHSSAGGPTDNLSRNIAKILDTQSEFKTIVLNKPGASHTIAYNYLLNSSKPALILGTPDIKKHPVFGELATVSDLGKFSILFFAHKDFKYTNLKEIEESKKEILFGYSGDHKTMSYLGMMEICKSIKCLPIPYKSGIEGITGILSKQIEIYGLVSYGSKSFLENNNLKVLHTLKDKDYVLTLFSKNLTDYQISKIKRILENYFNKKIMIDLGFE